MLRVILLLILGVVSWNGCSFYRVDSKDMSTDIFPPKDTAEKVVYLEKVDKPYIVIGIVNLSTQRRSPRDEVVARMRQEAAILGGDAITELVCDNAPVQVHYTAKVIVLK